MTKQPINQPTKESSRLPEDTPGQRIRKLRTDQGLSQKELAGLLGFTANYLGQIERDAKSLSKNMADAICSYFHVDYSYLYHGIHPSQTGEHNRVQDVPLYGHDIRTLLNTYIRSCSEDECRTLELIIKSLIHTLREVRWFERQGYGQIKDESCSCPLHDR